MSVQITTHVLDTAQGCGGGGMRVALRRQTSELAAITLDTTGRGTLWNAELPPGSYELIFEAGAYFAPHASFFDQIPVQFRIEAPGHYHVPLILSPYGYSTYRGG